MGVSGGVPRGARRPSHVAYYVAMAGIFGLLVLLCCYFFYYFIMKVKELRHVENLTLTPGTSARPAPVPAAYPVQPVVRDSASAMAKLCKQLPPQPGGKGDTVFPTSTSPAAHQTDTGDTPAPPAPPPDKAPAPAMPIVTCGDIAAR